MDDVLKQVVAVFAAEVKEQAQKIEAALLAMDGSPSAIPQQIEELYRQAHSLKGSSASLGVTELEKLAHHLEDALTPLRRGLGDLTPALVDAALGALDAARQRADGLAAGGNAGEAEALAAAEELRRLASDGEGVRDEATAVEATVAAPVIQQAESDGEGTMRVQAASLSALERRLDELRELRGRIDRDAGGATQIVHALERMWQTVRNGQTVGADALYHLLRQASALRRDLIDDGEVAQSHTVELEETLRTMRLVPAELLQVSAARAVREACRHSGKDARLEFLGGESLIDRRLLEEIKNPLLHLVRNAVDHGVESAIVREAVGKPMRATVTVNVEQRGREVRVEVRDDGRGVDVNKVRQRAVERGLLSESDAARLGVRETHELLFRPGFTTADEVTELSGRGVGLDVVRDAMVRLHGQVDVDSEPGRGATFTLQAPFTIAGSETMVLEESGRMFAVPLPHVERILRVRPGDLQAIGGRTFFHLDDQPMPVLHLARWLGLTEQHTGSAFQTLAVIRGAAARAAIICERIIGARDLLLRPLPPELAQIRSLQNAAVLPNGQAIFVLSPRALVEAASLAHEERRAPTGRQCTVLIADDAITTRAVLRTVLEGSGFRVRVAADGDEALRIAWSESIDLLVSDVHMPRLDGIGLCERLRADPRTRTLPIVLFSSLDSDDDRRRGTASGANAYLSKNAFDRGQLIDVVNSLVRG
jgi:chemotaxis protein histidine kinase CheA